ncbi:MAG TPA: glycoside hydrolase family 2, partial [Clostridiaceae bacterium]|nr:glycoside hydrolase family 2 [Clostridiaceae bacterium]
MGRKKVWVEFEGAYSNAVVTLNGNYVGKRPFGYSNFLVDLTRYIKAGEKNTLKVTVKNGMDMNSRWYTGAGLYRDVNLYVTDYAYIQLDSVKISTPSIDTDVAEILVNTEVVYEDRGFRELYVLTEIFDPKGEKIAQDKVPVTIGTSQKINVRQKMFVSNPRLWSPEEPNLYFCETRLMSGDRILDEAKN